MPIQPNFTHIVADDDSDVSVTGSELDINPTIGPRPLESSCEEDFETDDEMDEDSVDESDWSMNVTHIARTPERVPSPIFQGQDDNSRSEAVEREEEEEKEEPQMLPVPIPVVDIQMVSPDKSVLPPKRRVLHRVDEGHLCPLASGSSYPESIGRRVARRGRRSIVNMQPEVDASVALARPLDVTAYFQNLSFYLVQERVCQVPFLALRKRLDRIVTQAVIDSNMLKKTGQQRNFE
ncbi:hypothetical protein KR009_004643 [Drosophila setifemur]|nr:hypothetical protein KR009_004643 [Drosophila setifemur]